jgi:hypothetical protein
MGFAYYPDGDHDGKIELEPTVSWTSEIVAPEQQATTSNGTSSGGLCSATATCPTPMYFNGDTFLGNATDLAQSFGLDKYEPLFYHPATEWNAMNFSVRLNFDDDTYGRDIFYFCHVSFVRNGTASAVFVELFLFVWFVLPPVAHACAPLPPAQKFNSAFRRCTNTCRDGSSC